MELLTKKQIRALIKERNIKTVQDINDTLKDMFAEVLQEALEAELETELGYPKNGTVPSGSFNRRNGHTKKTVRSERGEIELTVPRDRDGDFEPIILPKYQKEVPGIEEQILRCPLSLVQKVS